MNGSSARVVASVREGEVSFADFSASQQQSSQLVASAQVRIYIYI